MLSELTKVAFQELALLSEVKRYWSIVSVLHVSHLVVKISALKSHNTSLITCNKNLT